LREAPEGGVQTVEKEMGGGLKRNWPVLWGWETEVVSKRKAGKGKTKDRAEYSAKKHCQKASPEKKTFSYLIGKRDFW